MTTDVHPELINSRFAYVSVSRGSHDAQIFTNDAATLAENLSRDVSKASAIEFGMKPVLLTGTSAQPLTISDKTPAFGLSLAR
jgi:hypothetical protein